MKETRRKIIACVFFGLLLHGLTGCFAFTRTLFVSNPLYRDDQLREGQAFPGVIVSPRTKNTLPCGIVTVRTPDGTVESYMLPTFLMQRFEWFIRHKADIEPIKCIYTKVVTSFDKKHRFSSGDVDRVGSILDTIELIFFVNESDFAHREPGPGGVDIYRGRDEHEHEYNFETSREEGGKLRVDIVLFAENLMSGAPLDPSREFVILPIDAENSKSIIRYANIHHGILSSTWRVLAAPLVTLVGDVVFFPLSLWYEDLESRNPGFLGSSIH